MAEFTCGDSKSINVDEHVVFKNNTDSDFEVSAGIIFHKSGIYDVSIGERRISVSKVAIEPQQQWIPCTERPPRKEGRYMVTRYDDVTNTEFIDTLWYEKNIWWNRHSTGDYAVTAWMPLPAPYREDEA